MQATRTSQYFVQSRLEPRRTPKTAFSSILDSSVNQALAGVKLPPLHFNFNLSESEAIATMRYSLALTAFLLSSTIHAHSWVEQLNIIASNGTMIGMPGYARGNAQRLPNVDIDADMVWLLPPNGRSGPNPNAILATDKICKPSQNQANQTALSPNLVASPGDMVALRYQENGHVTLPQNQPGKPANRGTVYIYGTTKPSADDTLLAIHKVWNAAGTGGDGRGVLLATRNFDDGTCYQVNSGAISVARQAQFQHTAIQPMGVNIWCQSDVTIPASAPDSGLYTMYWVWDWPTLPGTAGFPDGKNETYTTCMDIQMTSNSGSATSSAITDTSKNMKFVAGQDLNFAAISAQLATQFQVVPETANSTATTTSTATGGSKTRTSNTKATPNAKTQAKNQVTVTDYITFTKETTVTACAHTGTANNTNKLITPTPSPIGEANGSIRIQAITNNNTVSSTRQATKHSSGIIFNTSAQSKITPTATATSISTTATAPTTSLNVQPFTVEIVASSITTNLIGVKPIQSTFQTSTSSNINPVSVPVVTSVISTTTLQLTTTIYMASSPPSTSMGAAAQSGAVATQYGVRRRRLLDF